MKIKYFLLGFLLLSCKGLNQLPDSAGDSKQDNNVSIKVYATIRIQNNKLYLQYVNSQIIR